MPEQFESPSLYMQWSEAPWDQVVCGFPVLQITAMQVKGAMAGRDFREFEHARDSIGAGLVSCRLPHHNMIESMLLEDQGFRFIEMLYRPEFELLYLPTESREQGLTVSRACDGDMPALLSISGSAFRNERFRMDPRLDPTASDLRYQNWVASSQRHATQQLHVVRDAEAIVGFFVTELLEDGTCYWHLNALAPEAQGRGYGRRVWLCMLNLARNVGALRVCSSIAARNVRVIGLYARLGFQFSAPVMTFHWVRPVR